MSGAQPVRKSKSSLIGPVSPGLVQALPFTTKVEKQMLGKICMMMVPQRKNLKILLVVRPIESSWPKLKRGPVAKVTIMRIRRTYTKAGTIPLAVIVREVEESLVHVGEATDGEVQPGTRSYPLRAVQSLARKVHSKTRLRELTQRSTSTPLGPFETLGARTRTPARGHGGKDKLITAPTPLSATVGSSSRGHAASRQSARSSVRSPPSSEQLPSSANRQVSARSQRSRYVLVMSLFY